MRAVAVHAVVGWALVGLTACSPNSGSELYVELQTDFVQGEEIVGAATILQTGDRPRRLERLFRRDEDLTAGVRLAEFDSLESGSHTLEIELLGPDGDVVVRRPVRVEVSASTVATVLFTRSCRGVTCEDEQASACLGGACVPAECTRERADACGEVGCASDAECVTDSPCAAGVCHDGACLMVSDATVCADDAWCDPALGCVPRRGETEESTFGRCEGLAWAWLAGGSGGSHLSSVEVHSGGVVVAGDFTGPLELQTLTSGDQRWEGNGPWVMSLDRTGQVTWANHLIDTSQGSANSLALASDTEVVVLGNYLSAGDISGFSLPGDPSWDWNVYTARLDLGTGSVTGVQPIHSEGYNGPGRVTAVPGGGYIVSVEHGTDLNLGGATFIRDAYGPTVAAYDAAGTYVWASETVRGREPAGMVVDDEGHLVYVNGWDSPTIQRLDAAGTEVRVEAPDRMQDAAVVGSPNVVSSNGEIIAALSFTGSLDATMGVYVGQSTDIALFRLSSDDSIAWVHGFGGVGNDELVGLAARADGGVVLLARIDDHVDFGGGPIGRRLATSLALVGFSANGEHRFSCALPFADVAPMDLAVDADDRAYIVGAFGAQADFGAGLVGAEATRSAFLMAVDLP